ncbi:MAG: S41 family peptidase [Chitinophagaceae bacterium]
MKKLFLFLFPAAFFIFTSCQKELQPALTDNGGGGSTGNADSTILDSTLLIARDIYLWYNQIPDTFNARAYTDPAAIMTAIRQYSMEPGFTTPVDRYSFAIKQTDWNNLSNGVQQDFGMSVFFNDVTDLRVKYVEPEGPAGVNGIQRGWRITAINGNTNIDTSSSSINFIINAVFNSASTSFSFQKPDGSTVNLTLNAGTYQTQPVLADSVYYLSNSTVGYMVLNSFLGDTTQIYSDFSRIFNEFVQDNVSDVIIDLRYNGGGYVSVSQTLANYLVPDAGNGQTMFTQTFNDKNSNYNQTTNFQKTGSLDLSRIFFIASDNTASASELLINNLKPFLDEKLAGPAYHTYGKPVGFFPVPVGDWYAFPISFKTVNHDGNGEYFNGLTIDDPTRDGVDKNWGDTAENCLHSVLTFIQTGVFGRIPAPPILGNESMINNQFIINSNNKLDKKSFKGEVDTRKIKH